MDDSTVQKLLVTYRLYIQRILTQRFKSMESCEKQTMRQTFIDRYFAFRIWSGLVRYKIILIADDIPPVDRRTVMVFLSHLQRAVETMA